MAILKSGKLFLSKIEITAKRHELKLIKEKVLNPAVLRAICLSMPIKLPKKTAKISLIKISQF